MDIDKFVKKAKIDLDEFKKAYKIKMKAEENNLDCIDEIWYEIFILWLKG